MRIAASCALVTALGALFPSVASAAATAPAALGGSNVVTALVIAGAGAIVIGVIMLATPKFRRSGEPAAPATASGTPARSAFRAHPMGSPSFRVSTRPLEPATATDPAVAPAEDAPESAPIAEEPQSIAATAAAPTDEPQPTATEAEETASNPEPETTLVSEPLRSWLHGVPAPSGQPREASIAEEPAAAAEEWSGAGVATVASQAITAAPPHPGPTATTDPAPDLISALSADAAPDPWLDPEQPRAPMAAEPTGPTVDPEPAARAGLGEHSLVVPIAACILVGLTVHIVRSRRRRS